MKKNMFNSS